MLLPNLDLLCTAPEGVARLRELILTIAVQGKLVPQDLADEPASALLQKIRAEKDRLTTEGKSKRAKPLAEIAEEEAPFELPQGWEWVRLGEITNYGTTTKVEKLQPNTWVLDMEDIEKSSGRLLQRLRFAERPALSDKNCFSAGDVLYGKLRPYLNKVLVADEDGVCTTEIIPFHCYGDYVPQYFRLVLSSPFFLEYVNARSYGMKMPRLGTEDARNSLIPLPPLAEQSRIVTRVEELMRLCDALDAKGKLESTQHAQLVSTLLGSLTSSATPEELADNWQRVAQHFDLLLDRPEAIDALEQTLLQLAVRGLLVPQDPTNETANTLLARIRSEKDHLISEGKIKRDKPLPPISDEEKLFELPVGWEWVRINDLAEVQGGIQKTQLRRPIKLHFPYLRVANVQRDALLLEDMERFELSLEELQRWRLAEGDLLIVEGNGSADEIGRCAVWDGSIDPCVYQNHLIRVRCFQPDCMEFIKLFLNAPSGAEEMKRLAITTSGLYNLSVGKIRNYVVPMPSLAEQSRIVNRVATLRRLCTDLRHRLTAAQATQSHLAQALVESSNFL
ncbi:MULTISPECIES: restriction endonuclease subunit S [Delftia]|uniref:restriction endonuclease subunit S n=1 Tax=Delftia TaxID=80865 RepID=UPI000F82E91E|nr:MULTISPECIES: restriction endonuclease subunit S [Delftia]WEM00435.1 restriction endonuclease subunit S [Delftia tsuruhatensis]WQM81406.1 restriction endonuclease subunit S [Delftia tsuruhatensis]